MKRVCHEFVTHPLLNECESEKCKYEKEGKKVKIE